MLVDRHLRWCALRGLRPRTIEARRLAIARVERVVGPLECADAERLAAWWSSYEVSASARATELGNIREFYKWLQLEEIRSDDPTIRLVRPRVLPGQPRPVAEDALVFALANVSERVRPWILLAAYCGLRAGEISRLRGEHHQADSLMVDGKGGRQRVVPVHPMVDDELAPWRAGWLFPRRDGQEGPTPPHLVSQLANRELHALGIPETLHQFRHRYGTRLWQASRDLRLVQDLMGHVSPATVSIYTLWDTSRLDAVVAAL